MYEEYKVDLNATETTEPPKPPRPIVPVMDDTIDALCELHGQLNGLEMCLFGDNQEEHDRPPIKCFEDAIINANGMAKYAVERIIRIKQRLGV